MSQKARIRMPRTRVELDEVRCKCGLQGCDDTFTYITPLCHDRAPLKVGYDRKTGTIKMECAVCGKHVTEILVAKNILEV